MVSSRNYSKPFSDSFFCMYQNTFQLKSLMSHRNHVFGEMFGTEPGTPVGKVIGLIICVKVVWEIHGCFFSSARWLSFPSCWGEWESCSRPLSLYLSHPCSLQWGPNQYPATWSKRGRQRTSHLVRGKGRESTRTEQGTGIYLCCLMVCGHTHRDKCVWETWRKSSVIMKHINWFCNDFHLYTILTCCALGRSNLHLWWHF